MRNFLKKMKLFLTKKEIETGKNIVRKIREKSKIIGIGFSY